MFYLLDNFLEKIVGVEVKMSPEVTRQLLELRLGLLTRIEIRTIDVSGLS